MREYVYASTGLPIDAFNRPLIHIIDNQLILCRIFQRARLFLLPTLRLRLGFAIWFSKKQYKIFIANYFYALFIYGIINQSTSKIEN